MNTSMTEAIPITENKDIKKVLMLLQNNGAEQEKQDIESLVKHIELMESQFGRVLTELQDVKSQYQAIGKNNQGNRERRGENYAEIGQNRRAYCQNRH